MSVDRHLYAVALDAPGFAGLSRTPNGTFEVHVAPDASPDRILRAFDNHRSRDRFRDLAHALDASSVQFVTDAEHGFAALYVWLNELWPVFDTPGVTYSAIDERSNSIRIGVATESARSSVELRVVELDIPSSAIVIELGVEAVPVKDLRDEFRPMPGGVEINGNCSIAANVTSDIGAGFITASHCTPETFEPDFGEFWQPGSRTSPTAIGQEAADPEVIHQPAPPPNPCNADSTSVGCRYSDAAFVLHYDSTNAQHGYIARTTGIGSIDIDINAARFSISSADPLLLVPGDSVHKMGRTTGWTKGEVIDNCVNFHNWDGTGASLICQTQSTALVDGGDSGGPAFTWSGSGSDVDLEGVIAVLIRDPDTFEFVGSAYSSWRYVDLELGGEVGPLDPTL